MQSTCTIEGCVRAHSARGWCSAHYRRWLRHGSPVSGRTPPGDLMKFITEVAIPYSGDGCLTWPYGLDDYGYGQIHVDGQRKGVHRLVCEAVRGPSPSLDHEAAHSCGKGHEGCISPNHIRWDTPAGNHADKLAHGTHNRGTRHNMAKLSESDVYRIRSLRGLKSLSELAVEFGVTKSQISHIHRRVMWSWLPESRVAA